MEVTPTAPPKLAFTDDYPIISHELPNFSWWSHHFPSFSYGFHRFFPPRNGAPEEPWLPGDLPRDVLWDGARVAALLDIRQMIGPRSEPQDLDGPWSSEAHRVATSSGFQNTNPTTLVIESWWLHRDHFGISWEAMGKLRPECGRMPSATPMWGRLMHVYAIKMVILGMTYWVYHCPIICLINSIRSFSQPLGWASRGDPRWKKKIKMGSMVNWAWCRN